MLIKYNSKIHCFGRNARLCCLNFTLNYCQAQPQPCPNKFKNHLVLTRLGPTLNHKVVKDMVIGQSYVNLSVYKENFDHADLTLSTPRLFYLDFSDLSYSYEAPVKCHTTTSTLMSGIIATMLHDVFSWIYNNCSARIKIV